MRHRATPIRDGQLDGPAGAGMDAGQAGLADAAAHAVLRDPQQVLPGVRGQLVHPAQEFLMGGPVLLYSGCNNRRVFDERDLKWIQDLVCLKKCGMSIQEMKAYLDLCLQGPATIPQRKEMLTQKQEALRRTIQELEASAAYIDWKQTFYDDVLAGRRPYVSNLIPPENAPL